MIKYFPFLAIFALPTLAADDSYQFCGASLLPNTTHFSVQEVYGDGVIELQVGADVRLGLDCGLSEEGDFVGFTDWGAGYYEAEPDPLRASSSTIAKYPGIHLCNDSNTNLIIAADEGYFNAIPQRNPGTQLDYVIFDGKVHASVDVRENLNDTLTIRDVKQQIVAVARKVGTTWEIENPGQLSPAHIGFVLTHKVNQKVACWNSDGSNDNGGLGFWPSVGIAVGATAAITGLIAGTIYATLRICEKCDQHRRYEQVPQEREMVQEV